MAEISGKNGGVYSESLLVEDCEAVWTGESHAKCDVTRETSGKVGIYFIRGTTTDTGVGETTLLMTQDTLGGNGGIDLSTYEGIIFWARSNVADLTKDDLEFHLGELADCASATETLELPALTINVWQHCFALFAGATGGRDAILSIGLYQVTDLANGTFDLDDIRAVKEDQGIKSWTLDYTMDSLEVTDFANTGTRDYISGCSSWSGSFEGFKEGVPLSIGSEVYLVLGETNTAGQQWLGKVIITAAHPSVGFDGVVTYSYDFQGTSTLQAPTV